ncbi:DUF6056 family protein [Leucobacter aridicollis]|uniref:DUF6056 family protein n=1 Tax=Leucobacter aridicollis TaxID=283878 RepID=UPI00351D0108
MIGRLRSLLERSTALRYVLVGGIGYLFEMTVLFVAAVLLSQGAATSVTVSYWLGLAFSFVLQKLLAFGNRERSSGVLGAQAGFYLLLVFLNYGFTLVVAAWAAPAIGVFWSRTIALAITTIWNFFLYRTVIFGTASDRVGAAVARRFGTAAAVLRADRGAAVLGVLSVGFATVFMLLSLSATFVADDYSYLASIRNTGNALQYIGEHYSGHNGRISQNTLVTVGFLLFGERVLQVFPFLFFVSLSVALAWVLALLLPLARRIVTLSVALGSVLTAVAFLALPSLFDSYLWLTSSTVYLGGLVAFLVSLGLTITLARRERRGPLVLGGYALVLAAGQAFSEPVALLAIAAAGLWLVWEFIRRDWSRLRLSLLACIALIGGFLVVFLSPGTMARRAAVDNEVGLRAVLFGPFEHYETLTAQLTWWILLLVLVAGVITAMNLSEPSSVRRFALRGLALAAAIFCGSTYGVFAVSAVASPIVPLRNFTVPGFGVVISAYIVAVVAATVLRSATRGARLSVVAVAGSVVAVCVAAPFAFATANVQLQGLALRESMLAERAAQLDSVSVATASISVLAAPVLVVSQAVEVENPPRKQTDWLLNSFRAWHGVDQGTRVVPVHTPPGYCLPDFVIVKPEFVCGAGS